MDYEQKVSLLLSPCREKPLEKDGLLPPKKKTPTITIITDLLLREQAKSAVHARTCIMLTLKYLQVKKKHSDKSARQTAPVACFSKLLVQ